MNQESTASPGTLEFFSEVTKYFMDFLETNFHKRRAPKRSVKVRDSNNLLVGFSLEKYDTFYSVITKHITSGFPKEATLQVKKGQHKTKLTNNVKRLIDLQINQITTAQIDALLNSIAQCAEQEAFLNIDDLELARDATLEAAGVSFFTNIIEPFITSLEKSIINNDLGDKNHISMMALELAEIFTNEIDDKVSEVLRRLIAREDVHVEDEIANIISVNDLIFTLESYFENLRVADLFEELQTLDNNRAILDKQELYLYFGDIVFDQNKYPIFYIPMSLVKKADNYQIEFDTQIYINKKALEFIAEKFNTARGTRGTLNSTGERIIYISEHKEKLQNVLSEITDDIQNFFELKGSINFAQTEKTQARGADVQISNTAYLALFDKSDEALVNDYEEILVDLALEGNDLSTAFNQLLADFLQKNPEPMTPEIDQEWDDTETPDRLVASSPIPLNSEQLQILNAVRKPKCKYLIVEGPPGTGKSHTITAIVFDAILDQKSILVLSDKKEALDVVEKNITETMNKVRFDRNFQNPILRLGKTGNTYSQILSKSSISQIKTHHRAVKNEIEEIETTISQLSNSLKQDIEIEALAYSEVDLKEIEELTHLEQKYLDDDLLFDLEEVLSNEQGGYDLDMLRGGLLCFREIYSDKNFAVICDALDILPRKFREYSDVLTVLQNVVRIISETRLAFSSLDSSLSAFESINENDLPQLRDFLAEFKRCKKPIVGYSFSKAKLAKIDARFVSNFSYNGDEPSQSLSVLSRANDALIFIKELGDEFNADAQTSHDYVTLAHQLLTHKGFQEWAEECQSKFEASLEISSLHLQYPMSFEKLQINLEMIQSVETNKLMHSDEFEFNNQIRYVQLMQKIRNDFSKILDVDYGSRKRNIEQMVTTKVAYQLDDKVINFYEHSKNDAEVLKKIIKNKQKFPKEQFKQLSEAFPCILAGIRDFAEYIPLHHEIFDLLIIDEASQVSLAQAFPALIRAKKVIILGDRKQFSNIKAAQAKSDTNREYLSRLEDSFKKNVSRESAQLIRLEKFNIKTSVLDFFEYISNYNMQLLKHFRGYKEIISYSNKYFYQDRLQVMKIRGKGIAEVIKFSYVEPSENVEVYPNTNMAEVEFIVKELLRLKGLKNRSSVGIITPHTNQQKLLVEHISKLPERDYFLENFDLKIMTFDTCQGEERDIIYYSMVATEKSDKLWGVFIKDLSSVDIEEDGQIKAQRLNVGFSRGKECIHFVVSKPLDQFTGSIGEALRHYALELDQGSKERSVVETDPRSKMEPEVLNWFYQTNFWTIDNDNITFIPQFEIGKYLKQLDPRYTHPMYKVDFLVVYRDSENREKKIVIEYDGFYEHFTNTDIVNENNYEIYLSDGDVYRQKVLESYGYQFLRINKFNVGGNPVETLDKRLKDLVKPNKPNDVLRSKIHDTIGDLQSGDQKECPKCKEVQSIKQFKDSSLSSGVGRFCRSCKGGKVLAAKKTSKSSLSVAKTSKSSSAARSSCPKCGSKMVRRSGRYGFFHGCSRYPYCKGTR